MRKREGAAAGAQKVVAEVPGLKAAEMETQGVGGDSAGGRGKNRGPDSALRWCMKSWSLMRTEKLLKFKIWQCALGQLRIRLRQSEKAFHSSPGFPPIEGGANCRPSGEPSLNYGNRPVGCRVGCALQLSEAQ